MGIFEILGAIFLIMLVSIIMYMAWPIILFFTIAIFILVCILKFLESLE